MGKHAFAVEFAAGKIDAAAGVIYGVSLATEGPARGHGVHCDRTTLEQLRECARAYSGGLKVKMTHRGDAGDIVGFLSNLRIEGKKLLGDLHLLESYEKRAYILELATKIPDTFGLSVAFSGPTEERGGLGFARCTEIYSCDLVSEPAANPTGLFETGNRKPDTGNEIDAGRGGNLPPSMTHDEVKVIAKALVDTALVEFSGRVKAVEDSLKTFAAGADVAAVKKELGELKGSLETAQKEFSAKLGDDAKRIELAAKTVAQEFAGRIGNSRTPADGGGNGGNATPPAEPAAAEKFDGVLTKHFAATKSTGRAWQLAALEDPKGHQAFIKAGKKPTFETAKG
jgi:hypothetical protein